MAHPEFENVGRTMGLVIWRIENFKLIRLIEKDYGSFFTGDSYIVLNTKVLKNNTFEWDIHFWLGHETSIDEAGTAAIKTIELDDYLGGKPVQYREVQEHESDKFLSYFKNSGIRYLNGGVRSGFKNISDIAVENKLYLVKGTRNVRVTQVPLSVNSLNKNDVFILDTKNAIYQWNGPDCNKMEKLKANVYAKKIRDDEHGGKSQIYYIESDWNNNTEFWKIIGGSVNDIKNNADLTDEQHEKGFSSNQISLYRVSDFESSAPTVTFVSNTPLTKSMLDSNDCFIVDCNVNGIYSWIGKKCTKNEKIKCIQAAKDLIEKNKYPSYTQIIQSNEDSEPVSLKSIFIDWSDKYDTTDVKKTYNINKVAGSVENTPAEMAMFHKIRNEGILPNFMPDNAEGNAEVYRIYKNEINILKPELQNIFQSNSCYIVKYTSETKGTILLYYWLGLNSTTEDKARTAFTTVEMDNQVDGQAIQIRVVQNKEPEHFIRIFRGKLIILKNEPASNNETRLFHVKGTNKLNIRTIELDVNLHLLDSFDVYLLNNPLNTFIWTGNNSVVEEKEGAFIIANLLFHKSFNEISFVIENNETDAFWLCFPKSTYEKYLTNKNKNILNKDNFVKSTRLFHCSNASGKFKVEEIFNFTHEDLIESDIMLLDVYYCVFVWIGNSSNNDEKRLSFQAAIDYLNSDPTPRDSDNTLIIEVKQGSEPEEFKNYFNNWK